VTRLRLFSEKFSPSGGAAAKGISVALGAPKLDHVSVLVREAVQNSWDARLRPGTRSDVSVSASVAKFSKSELSALKTEVFNDVPPGHPLNTCMTTGLHRLVFEDRGTFGLCGPTFVDRDPKPSDRFLNFCRMFGRASEDDNVGGGTYGYGKAVHFRASSASTIVIYSRVSERNKKLDRLIAMSLWKSGQGKLHTGRHWWGVASITRMGAVGPLEGAEAAALAKRLGFTPFEEEQTGTSIMILAPNLPGADSGDLELVAKRIAESMVIWFWPRMLGGADDLGKLEFSVSCGGKEIPMLDPRKDVPFNSYARALKSLIVARKENKGVEPPGYFAELKATRPKARLGFLSLQLANIKPRKIFAITAEKDEDEAYEHVFGEQVRGTNSELPRCSHVALIRGPGQVIKYARHRPYIDPGFEYMGVFLVDGKHDHRDRPKNDIDLAFAESEPPTHDDWVAGRPIDSWHQTYVRVALRDIKAGVESFVQAGKTQLPSGSQDPLGGLASELGALISAPGDGATRPAGGARRPGGGKRGEPGGLKLLGDGQLEEKSGRLVYVVPFEVSAPNGKDMLVSASPRVVVAGGGVEDPDGAPEGASVPEVLEWRGESRRTRSKQLLVRGGERVKYEVVVSVPNDTMLSVSLNARPAEERDSSDESD
jgi:hypothetical protein